MSQKLPFSLDLELELFQLEELSQAETLANKSDALLYCWKSIGVTNWLEKGISISDELGFVILPRGLPEQIDLPDDPPDSD